MIVKISDVMVDGRFKGQLIQSPMGLMFFGSNSLRKAELPTLFPDLAFSFLKQTHSDRFVRALSSAHLPLIQSGAAREGDSERSGKADGDPDADAQYTQKSRLALVVQTADCVPLLWSDGTTAIAVHAGWRGVASEISKKIFSEVSQELILKEGLLAVGPHIGPASFLVREDAVAALAKSAKDSAMSSNFTRVGSQWRVNLQSLLRTQVPAQWVRNWVCVDFDTYVDERFASHRRQQASGRDLGQRQWSFVALF